MWYEGLCTDSRDPDTHYPPRKNSGTGTSQQSVLRWGGGARRKGEARVESGVETPTKTWERDVGCKETRDRTETGVACRVQYRPRDGEGETDTQDTVSRTRAVYDPRVPSTRWTYPVVRSLFEPSTRNRCRPPSCVGVPETRSGLDPRLPLPEGASMVRAPYITVVHGSGSFPHLERRFKCPSTQWT